MTIFTFLAVVNKTKKGIQARMDDIWVVACELATVKAVHFAPFPLMFLLQLKVRVWLVRLTIQLHEVNLCRMRQDVYVSKYPKPTIVFI